MTNSIPVRIAELANRDPAHPALLGQGRDPIRYGDLARQIALLQETMRHHDIDDGDVVAILTPDTMAMAVLLVAITSWTTAIPLNPTLPPERARFVLDDANVAAVITTPGARADTVDLARGVGINVVTVDWREGLLASDAFRPTGLGALSTRTPDAVALLLHTSGTTARPKRVPLTQRCLGVSAHNIARSLQLGEHDRCLNLMPLYHIHGIMAGLFASLVAGAGVVCASPAAALDVVEWLQNFRPTWYTAVPTLHQTILSATAEMEDALADHTLRLIRSSSASLAPATIAELESRFGVPVIEAYGMTEAAHQITSNPLPPAIRKPGSVGIVAGTDVAVMAQDAPDLLPAGDVGEVVLRGPAITPGYLDNPAANRAAFDQGWFRTGDLGHFDTDGYLYLTGRLKEMINRGGETVAPRVIDEALAGHPGVRQAVAFAVPHPTLGEDIAAAVIPAAGAQVTERELRRFAMQRLEGHQVPSRILLVDTLPTGPSGKLQRIGLATALAAELQSEFLPPVTPLEIALAEIWIEVLGIAEVGRTDNFFTLGGDSLMGGRVMARILKAFQLELPPSILFEEPTLADLAVLIAERLMADLDM